MRYRLTAPATAHYGAQWRELSRLQGDHTMYNVNTIPTDLKTWSDITPSCPDWQFRISTLRGVETLWRKNNHPAFYGGHQIQRIALNTRLAREWLEAAGYDTFALNMAAK